MDKIEKIAKFYRRTRRMPAQRELQRLLNYKSRNSAFKLLNKLEAEGVIKRDSTGRTSPTGKLFGNLKHLVPLMPASVVGFSSPQEEELIDTMTLDEWMIPRREGVFTATAHGDSMKDAGIIEGDMILLDKSLTAKVGDMVIARLDGEDTIKYLGKDGSRYCLIPANKKYPTYYPEEELQIIGVVIGVMRKLHV